MIKLLALVSKEWKLLFRDKIGLLILFVLPMCLVMFMSLTQQPRFDGSSQFKLLVVNFDAGKISSSIIKAIKKSDHFKLTQATAKNKITLSSAKKAVANGDYQALLFIPHGTTQSVDTYITQLARGSVTKTRQPQQIKLYLDPGLATNIASSIKLTMKYMLKNIEYNVMNNFAVQRFPDGAKSFNKNMLSLQALYPTVTGQTSKLNITQFPCFKLVIINPYTRRIFRLSLVFLFTGTEI